VDGAAREHVRPHPVSREGAEPSGVRGGRLTAGIPVAVNGRKMGPAKLLAHLNALGGKHGIGRVDLVENRYVGMKSHGVYETPGGTILHAAHRAVESLTLDREVSTCGIPSCPGSRTHLQRLLVFAGDGSPQGDGPSRPRRT